MKRILGFLLIVIVVVAVFVPCCMYDNCQDDLVTKQDAPKKSTTDGSCSPFSMCASCHGFTTAVEPISVLAPTPEHPDHFITNTTFVATVYAPAFWQPPRSV